MFPITSVRVQAIGEFSVALVSRKFLEITKNIVYNQLINRIFMGLEIINHLFGDI